MTERDFEQRVRAAFKKRGYFCERLRGPEGYPNLTVLSDDAFITVELKVCNTTDKINKVFQPTQIPYFIKHARRLNSFIFCYIDDIKKIWIYYPATNSLDYMEFLTSVGVGKLKFPGQAYENIPAIINNLVSGGWL